MLISMINWRILITFFTTPTTQEEVLEILLELDPNKTGDIYKISPKYAIDSRCSM